MMTSQLAQMLWHNSIFLSLVSILAICGYIPINRLLRNGRIFKHHWDDSISIWPSFVYPYFMYLPWLAMFYGTLVFQPLWLIQQVTVATLVSVTIGYSFFILWPTYVELTELGDDSLADKILQWIHVADKQFNAFPSMHVYMTVLLMYFCSQAFVVFTPVFIAFGVAICLSTVLTKSHYMYDVPGGVCVGLFALWVATTISP